MISNYGSRAPEITMRPNRYRAVAIKRFYHGAGERIYKATPASWKRLRHLLASPRATEFWHQPGRYRWSRPRRHGKAK